MATREFKSGIGGSVVYDGNTLCVVEWTLNLEATSLDTTNTCDGIYGSFITGPINVSGDVKSYYDTANSPLASPVDLFIGDAITILLDVGDTGKYWTVPAIVDKISQTNNVKGVVSFDFSFKLNPPGGSLGLPT